MFLSITPHVESQLEKKHCRNKNRYKTGKQNLIFCSQKILGNDQKYIFSILNSVFSFLLISHEVLFSFLTFNV